jgi:hypothetical protein
MSDDSHLGSGETRQSEETRATSPTLAPLQARGPGEDLAELEPLENDDPASFDLVAPPRGEEPGFSLEARSQQLFSRAHLEKIFADPSLLLRFTSFLSVYRPQSVPILIYYLDALKALKAIAYANAIAEALDPIPGHDFTSHKAKPTANADLEEKASKAFDALVNEDLPAYITHVYVQTASVSISKKVQGSLAPHLREASEGLAEVFCLTDPSRHDNPIVFVSEGAIGRPPIWRASLT